LVARTTKYSVIPVTRIERPVHLIPKFGSDPGVTEKVKRELDRASEVKEWMDTAGAGDIPIADGEPEVQMRFGFPATDSVSYYKEFWLNSWIDHHLYKNVY